MTVAELIAKLEKLDKDLPVCYYVDGDLDFPSYFEDITDLDVTTDYGPGYRQSEGRQVVRVCRV